MDYTKEYIKVKNYINGEWIEEVGVDTMPIYNPSTGEVIGEVPFTSQKTVDVAVNGAAEAFKIWGKETSQKRVSFLFELRNKMKENTEELAAIIARDQAKHIEDARGEVNRVIQIVETACSIPMLAQGEKIEISPGLEGQVVRKPLGVIGGISPYNFPALVFGWFIPYAIGTGNTIVYKASEQSPLFMQRMLEILAEIGLPKGVVNLVNGDYRVGEAIMANSKVKGVCFVGSTPVGKRIAEVCGKEGKRSMVLAGAKNTLLVMEDVKMDGFVGQFINSCFGAAGQRCMAGSIVAAVPEIYDKVKEKMIEAAKKLKVGDARDPEVYVGPVISKKHQERILNYIQLGIKEGANLVLDGRNPDLPEKNKKGFFVGPTILSEVTPEMTIAKEEIFGPVVSLMKVKDIDHALEVMNSSEFGNGGAIFTQNGYYAQKFLDEIDVGMAGVNVGVPASMPYLPFGGTKNSLFGSEIKAQGKDGIEFFTKRNVATVRFFPE
ncbi:MAG: aldehyde dehydrogenase family protein [Peptococcales bacterium]|jgi:malonate-semialdehyde dehydrogenase (acetylating)/methylmalonate-semialdehyde dehydrogenase